MKQIKFFAFFFFFTFTTTYADINKEFEIWKKNFKKEALQNNISEETFNKVMSNTKFLPDVIKYDRYQPEHYEDTKTYISKRTSKNKVLKGINFYKDNAKLINSIENNFDIEKELLLSLMGIETNFGTYVGKMDILSSLATLSFDKEIGIFYKWTFNSFKTIEKTNWLFNIIWSWAGAFGFFQFMPSTMKNYAIDYDNNNYIT